MNKIWLFNFFFDWSNLLLMFKKILFRSSVVRKNERFFHQPKVLILPKKTETKIINQNSFKFLSKEINESLKSLGILEPSEIQQSTIPTILKGKNTLFAAQTGLKLFLN